MQAMERSAQPPGFGLGGIFITSKACHTGHFGPSVRMHTAVIRA
jgi:hypothetical protein